MAEENAREIFSKEYEQKEYKSKSQQIQELKDEIENLKKVIEIYKNASASNFIYVRCEHCDDNNPEFK